MDRKTLIAMIACGVIMILYYPFIMPLLSPKKTVLSEATKEEIPSTDLKDYELFKQTKINKSECSRKSDISRPSIDK